MLIINFKMFASNYIFVELGFQTAEHAFQTVLNRQIYPPPIPICCSADGCLACILGKISSLPSLACCCRLVRARGREFCLSLARAEGIMGRGLVQTSMCFC